MGLSFEKLAQQWVVVQACAGELPFAPEAVGSHWSRRVQVDVVAINHQSREILLGECNRAGFTQAAAAELTAREGVLVDLPALGEGLSA